MEELLHRKDQKPEWYQCIRATPEARKQQSNTFKILRENKFQPRIL